MHVLEEICKNILIRFYCPTDKCNVHLTQGIVYAIYAFFQDSQTSEQGFNDKLILCS
jgi:hypothetical protein